MRSSSTVRFLFCGRRALTAICFEAARLLTAWELVEQTFAYLLEDAT